MIWDRNTCPHIELHRVLLWYRVSSLFLIHQLGKESFLYSPNIFFIQAHLNLHNIKHTHMCTSTQKITDTLVISLLVGNCSIFSFVCCGFCFQLQTDKIWFYIFNFVQLVIYFKPRTDFYQCT